MRKLFKFLAIGLTLVIAVTAALFYWLPTSGCEVVTYSMPEELILAPDGKLAYLSDSVAKRLLVFSLTDNRLAANVALPAPTTALALSRDGAKVYLLSGGTEAKVFIVDAATRQVDRTIEVAGDPEGLAISVDGSRLFTAQRDAHKLIALDVASGKASAGVPFDCQPCRIAATTDGKALVAANQHGVTVFDAQNLAILNNIPTTTPITQFALSSGGKTLAYPEVEPGHGAGVSFLDLASGAAETRATMGPVGNLAFSADGASVIASDIMLPRETHGSLSIMPAHIPQEVKGAIVPSIPPDRSVSLTLDKFPHAIAIDAKRNHIDVVAMPQQGVSTLEVIDEATLKVLAQIALPDAKTSFDRFIAWRAGVLRPKSAQCL